jgi:hypothetical protein
MALTKRPAIDSSKVDAFISGAPDAKGQGVAPAAAPAPTPAAAPVPAKPAAAPVSTRKHPISLTIAPALLARMDEAAAARGLSRAAAFADACADWLKAKGAA